METIDSHCFFIFSCPRSGSSLLSRMLNQHSEIAIPYESQIFNYFYPWIDYYGDLSKTDNLERFVSDILSTDFIHDWSNPPSQEEVIKNVKVPNFGGVFNAILESWMIRNKKKLWGEKTPRHIFYWKEILSIFPNAKIIFIVRDGRDVALSLLGARFGPKTIYGAAKWWEQYCSIMEVIESNIPKERFVQVAYEDLISKPKENLTRICKFLDLEYESTMLDFHTQKSEYKSDSINQENLKKPVMSNNMNKWRNEFSPKERHFFDKVAGEYLEKNGYSRSIENKSRKYGMQWLIHKYVENPVKKGVAMVKNRKGHKNWLVQFKIVAKLIYENCK